LLAQKFDLGYVDAEIAQQLGDKFDLKTMYSTRRDSVAGRLQMGHFFAIQKDQQDFKKQVTQIILQMDRDGAINDYLEKWGLPVPVK
jgi:ABC-type amino acid transport substrate-binding protein